MYLVAAYQCGAGPKCLPMYLAALHLCWADGLEIYYVILIPYTQLLEYKKGANHTPVFSFASVQLRITQNEAVGKSKIRLDSQKTFAPF